MTSWSDIVIWERGRPPLHPGFHVADFTRDYGVEPIFHFDWSRRQVFLAIPAEPVGIDRASCMLPETMMRKLRLHGPRHAKACEPWVDEVGVCHGLLVRRNVAPLAEWVARGMGVARGMARGMG